MPPPPRPFVNDALWRCLCPGFSPHATLSSVAGPRVSPAPRRGRDTLLPQPTRRPLRSYTTDALSHLDYAPRQKPAPPQPAKTSSAPFDPHATAPPGRRGRDGESAALLPTYLLYEHLRSEGEKGNFFGVLNACRVLIEQRGEVRNAAMYTAMLHSFVDPANGTAGKVRAVLEEMGFWGHDHAGAHAGAHADARQPIIELDAQGCERVLEVLAVHPDYLLRDEILEYMKARWYVLTDLGSCYVIAGLLRDRHFEHALEMLDDMVRSPARVNGWLFDMAMWTLLEYGEVEEAFYVLSLKEARQRGMVAPPASDALFVVSEALWGALLDAAARMRLVEHANKVWMSQVQPGHHKPGTGTCLAVLALAAHHGLVPLATDVLRVLTERGTPLTPHHYELLNATYLNANDLHSALSALLIMADANLKVDEGTCNPVFQYLAATPAQPSQQTRPMQAFTMLQSFEASGRTIPVALVNACIQASIAVSGLPDALELYKALHTIVPKGPSTQTFNILFRGCYLSERKDLAMFLVNEMTQLKLKPDRVTYDRLILVCLKTGHLEEAMSYYEEMTTFGVATGKKGDKPRRKTWELLITTCVQQGDERAVALLEAYKQGVDEPRRDVERAVVGRFQKRGGLEALEALEAGASK